MTNQEAFDFVCEKFAEQGGPSADEETCLYRSKNGRKCAAGWFIPDELYSIAFEEKTVAELPPSIFSPAPDLVFLRALQKTHDHSARSTEPLPTLQVELRCLARKYGLDGKAAGKITKWEHAE